MTTFWITVITWRQGFAKLGVLGGMRLWGSIPERERQAQAVWVCVVTEQGMETAEKHHLSSNWKQRYLRPGWHQVLLKLGQKVASFLTIYEALSVFVIWVNSAGGNLLLNQYTIFLRIFLHAKVKHTLSMFLNTAWKDDNYIEGWWMTLSWGRKSGSGLSKQISHHTLIG